MLRDINHNRIQDHDLLHHEIEGVPTPYSEDADHDQIYDRDFLNNEIEGLSTPY
jgi:hypothetical protein